MKQKTEKNYITIEDNSNYNTITNRGNNNFLTDVKITKNIDTLSRLINNSNNILSHQNSLIEKCEEMTKRITSSDYEIERLINKNESDDFPLFLEKYSSKLQTILGRLKSHTDEVEEMKCKINIKFDLYIILYILKIFYYYRC